MTSMSHRVLPTRPSRPAAWADSAQLRTKQVGSGRLSERSHPGGIGAELPDNIAARRNVLTALWAGKLLGLSGDDLTAYASSRRFLSETEAKLALMLENDLRRGGVALSRSDIRAAMIRFHRVALHQTSATD